MGVFPADVLHQRLDVPAIVVGLAVEAALQGPVLQVDHATPAHQALPGHQRQAGEDADPVRHCHRRADCHYQEGAPPSGFGEHLVFGDGNPVVLRVLYNGAIARVIACAFNYLLTEVEKSPRKSLPQLAANRLTMLRKFGMRPRNAAVCSRHVTSILMSLWVGVSANAQETCGLQDANFDTIFANAFDPAAVGGGLGPPSSTVPPPVLGVAPTITITWPTANTQLPRGKVQIVGTVTGSTNTGVAVADTVAYVSNGVFVTPELTVDTTVTGLTAVATTMDGLSASATVSVTASAAEPDAALSTATPVGFAPLPVRFRLGVKSGLVLQTVAIDFDGNGTTDFTGSSVANLPVFTYPAPGAYTATANLTFSNQPPFTVKSRVIALSLPDQRSAICATYAHLRARLTAQDATGAGYALMGTLKARLMPMFTALGSRMPSVAANLGVLADGVIGFDAADIISVRDLPAEVRGYPVHFARDPNGVWRIESM